MLVGVSSFCVFLLDVIQLVKSRVKGRRRG
jgi:hypothetical protein